MKSVTVMPLKPRNPFALAGRLRMAGAHRPSRGGERQQAMHQLRRELRDMDRQRHSP